MTLPQSATVIQPGEGTFVTIGVGTRCTFKVVGENTKGQFGLFEFTMEPGIGGPPNHTHRVTTEVFYVVEGELELTVGDKKMVAKSGSTAFVPPGAVHGFNNPGSKRAVLLVMFGPADSREKYFEGLAELTKDGKRPDPKALIELMRQHDTEPAVEAPVIAQPIKGTDA